MGFRLFISYLCLFLVVLSPWASEAQNTVGFQQAVVQISGSGDSISQSGNVQGSGSQSSNAQSSNYQAGDGQSSNGQWYGSPSPAFAVCPINQGWPTLPGSCDGGTISPVPPSVARPPNCPLGTVSCEYTGHPGFCCASASWCCIDLIHQPACCALGSCCSGAIDYGPAGPPGGTPPTINNNARRMRVSAKGMLSMTLFCVYGMTDWRIW